MMPTGRMIFTHGIPTVDIKELHFSLYEKRESGEKGGRKAWFWEQRARLQKLAFAISAAQLIFDFDISGFLFITDG
jgi:hypothetical protein